MCSMLDEAVRSCPAGEPAIPPYARCYKRAARVELIGGSFDRELGERMRYILTLFRVR
jgi:hypothetical protein